VALIVLCLVLFLAATSTVALRPAHRGPLAVLAWTVGWPAGEMAPSSAGLTAAAVGFLWWWQWPQGWLSLAIVVLASLSLLSNGVLYSASLYARVAVSRSLAQGPVNLNEWRVAPAYATWLRSLTFLPWRPRRIRVTRNISYGPDPAHRLDVLRGPNTPDSAPVLFYIHGGAWVYGDKEQQARPMMYEFASQGFIVVTANYRHAPRHPWPAQITDVIAARAWIAQNIAAHGGDPSRVVVSGGSAGGHLAALLALVANDPAWRPTSVDRDLDLRVRGAIPIYGVLDMTGDDEIWRRRGAGLRSLLEKTVIQRPLDEVATYELASPYHRIGAGAPSMLLIQGLVDTLVDANVATSFAREFADRVPHGSVWTVTVPLAQHAFDLSLSPRTAATTSAALAFARWATSPAAPQRAALTAERLASYAVPPASLVVWHDNDWREPMSVAAQRGDYDVVTAMNPARPDLSGSSSSFNDTATERLRWEAAAKNWTVADSEGRDPTSPHWNEAGLALWNLDTATVRDLSERYGQFAWYHVTPTSIEVHETRR